MNLRITHPSLHRLLWHRAAAKMRRLSARLLAPKRWLMTLVAVGLTFVWLSQIIISIFFRAPADAALLAERIALGMMVFTIWQTSKLIFRKPVEPFEWTPCEIQLLKTAPVERRELVGYRLLTTVYSVLMKSLCFVLVMLPDLNMLWAGFIGCVLGLGFCEFSKTVVEVIIHGTGKRGRLISRTLAATGIGSLLIVCTAKTAGQGNAAELLASPAAWKFLLAMAYAAGELTRSGIGAILAGPFRTFTEIMLAKSFDVTLFTNLAMGAAMSAGSFWAALNADRWMVGSRRSQEQRALQNATEYVSNPQVSKKQRSNAVSVPHRLGGVGAIAWRQFLGAWHYRSSIFFSFLLPVILCCIPLFAKAHHEATALFLVASVAFYSYLLLPAALMLDFRRDVDRMAVLKTMPISTRNIVLGQLTAPVALCCLFQAIVFVIAVYAGVASAGWFLLCWLAFIPMNILIMAFENLIFMLHPYRRNKEGVDVFIRTILTFTGKGLSWGAGAALVLLWAFACKYLATNVIVVSLLPPAVVQAGLLIGGCSALVLAISALLIFMIIRLFDRYDPSTDAVAMN